jgi:hypothetical protein
LWAADHSGKAAELKSSGFPALYAQPLGKYVFDQWSDHTGKSMSGGGADARASVAFSSEDSAMGNAGDSDTWSEFTSSASFDLLAKYLALGDKLASEEINDKMFHEARPLGRGAFGAVFLVFKKVRSPPA